MTQSYTLAVQPRTIKGNDVRKLRNTSTIPGVLYGNGVAHLMFQIDYNTFVKLYKNSGRTHIVNVSLEGKTYPCLVHDIDVDPVKDTARHIDFYVVNLKEKVQVEVPLEFVGESPAVTQGNIVSENLHEVEVEALPGNVPESITVDLSVLVTLQDNIHVRDLPVTKNYIILTDPELVVASVVEPEVESTETPAEAAAAVIAASTPATPPAETK